MAHQTQASTKVRQASGWQGRCPPGDHLKTSVLTCSVHVARSAPPTKKRKKRAMWMGLTVKAESEATMCGRAAGAGVGAAGPAAGPGADAVAGTATVAATEAAGEGAAGAAAEAAVEGAAGDAVLAAEGAVLD